jgi:hypothetical protein
VTLEIQSIEFRLGFIRPGNLVSHVVKLLEGCHVASVWPLP